MPDFLTIETDNLRAQVSPWGAALARLWLKGHDSSLLLGLPAPEDYRDAPGYMGVVVAPVAGRISGARAQIGGVAHDLPANAPPHCLHSGPDAAQHRLWQVTRHTPASLSLRCRLEDGACGLPGTRDIEVTYTLDGADLSIEISADTDALTLMNPASHGYWVLDGTGGLGAHRMQLTTTRVLEAKADVTPSGRILDAAGGDFDFSALKSPVAGPPLDHCFCISDRFDGQMRDVLRLQSDTSGIALRLSSNQPGLVLYTAENMPSLPSAPGTPAIGPFSAIAIEAQGWPDAPAHPHFPQYLLEPGREYRQFTRFSFSSP